jgi:toxin ParE1/3/4
MKIRWTVGAERDLNSIFDHIIGHDPKAALSMYRQIRERVEALGRFPKMGRPGRISGTRELVLTGTPYVVPYRIQRRTVVILAVVHAARRWPDRF